MKSCSSNCRSSIRNLVAVACSKTSNWLRSEAIIGRYCVVSLYLLYLMRERTTNQQCETEVKIILSA